MTDKNQADLLEALFGKRQAQIGAAILSNFSQAEKAIDTMANSAGSAMAEMENIYNSLEYKINKLKETWVGVAQDLFNDDFFKGIIDALIALSEAVSGLTDKFGLLGIISAGSVITGLTKLVQTAGRPKLTGFIIVPAYTPVVTRNELAA